MTAAHYIALLLLSTAAENSAEHHEIVKANDSGIWRALLDLDLVELCTTGIWRLSGRGRALVEHVLALPLPEQVTSWRMPGVPGPSTDDPIGTATAIQDAVRRWNESGVPAAAVPKPHAPDADSEGDGPPPPKPPPPKPIPGITPAEDPQARRAQALELMNRGYGTSEIADTLEMDSRDVEQIFFGGA